MSLSFEQAMRLAGLHPRDVVNADCVRKLLNYDPSSGDFTRRVSLSPKTPAGSLAGSIDDMGYVRIGVNGKRYRAHQLAWLYMTGEWPDEDVDHINGFRSDNRWENLRSVSRKVNLQNRRANNPANKTSGLLGASWSRQANRWTSCIRINGKTRYLGLYDTAEEAHAAYVDAKRKFHEGCVL